MDTHEPHSFPKGFDNKTLLEKARGIISPKRVSTVTNEMEDVALAWVCNEINITQIARAMGLNNSGYRVYAKLALALKQYIRYNLVLGKELSLLKRSSGGNMLVDQSERDDKCVAVEFSHKPQTYWCVIANNYCCNIEPKCDNCSIKSESSNEINGG
jgi:hypothetical protein